MRVLLMTCLVLALTCTALVGEDKDDTPKEAKTTTDILKSVETHKGFGDVCTAEFRNREDHTFVVWYNPYSGVAACKVNAYRFDAKAEQWVRFLSQECRGTHAVSVESGRGLIIRNVEGEVIYKDKVKN